MLRQGRYHFSALARRIWDALGVLLLVAILASCSFTGAQPTAEPFNAPAYQPDAATESITTTQVSTQTTAVGGSTESTATGVAVAAAPAAAAPVAAAPAAAAPVAPASVATAPLAQAGYNAEIVTEQQVVVVAQVNGQILEMMVDVGSEVKAGDVLARVETTALEAQRAQALAGLDAVKSQLDLLNDSPKEADLEAARAGVAAAGAAYTRAANGPTDEERRLALAQLKQAQAAVTVAQAGYNLVKGNPNIGALPQSLQLQQATLAIEAAQAQYDKLMLGATADVIAGAYAQLANARAALQRLEDGAKAAQVNAAEAQVRAAETTLYLAQLQLNKATITSPIDGVVSRVTTAVGAMAAPGTPVVTLLSPAVKITIAVEEARLSQLQIGQKALIRVDAYPDQTFEGAVAIIAPELDANTRTVQVTIRPTGDADVLAPGMSATVELVEE